LTVTGQRSLTPEVQVVLYRIAQESLNNIIKYSKATMVCIDLQMSPAGVLLSIRDNGIGFNPESLQPTSLGLRIMRERAESIGADLAVVSAPGKGTMVEVSWNEVKMEETA
jgi:signal transduction histidine kinase